jgi:hypothetical protein
MRQKQKTFINYSFTKILVNSYGSDGHKNLIFKQNESAFVKKEHYFKFAEIITKQIEEQKSLQLTH